MRRTTSIDVTRPNGLLATAIVLLQGQDLATGPDGQSTVLERWAATFDVDPATSTVLGVDGAGVDGLTDLVGTPILAGFGRRVASLLPAEGAARTLRHSLLEDLAGGYLVSGYAPLRAGLLAGDPEASKRRAPLQADICMGWASGGPLHAALADHGHTAVPMGPQAPAIERDDPSGWHPLPPLGEATVRRRRLLDVAALGDGRLAVRSHFRDSWAGDGGEMVMHEYAIDATVAGGQIEGITVDPRVLPWEACPGAVASASRVVGVAVDDLATTARSQLVGPSTCTHLTSTIRSLADLRALAPLVGAS